MVVAFAVAALVFAAPVQLGEVHEEGVIPLVAAILDAEPRTTVDVTINSPGGRVDVGLAVIGLMEMAQREKMVRFRCHAGDIVASMATVIFAQCDERRAQKNTRFLIHPVWVVTRGNGDQLREAAKRLDFLTHVLYSIISERTGYPVVSIHARAAGDWWFNTREAVRIGLVNRAN